jgi:hypothetical protein
MLTRRLFDIRNHFDASAADEKLSLLQQLNGKKLKTAAEIKRLHSALCFIRAFPDSAEHYRLAHAELALMEQRVAGLARAQQPELWDTGIIGTPVHYGFSYVVAAWLERRAAGAVSIDWDEIEDPQGLDEILIHILQPAEDEYFDSGYVSAREWIELAAANTGGTDFDWLLAQLKEQHLDSIWAQLYNAADVWLTWDLRGARLSKSLNTFPVKQVCSRQNGMRKATGSIKKEIMRPLESVSRLPSREGSKLIDVAMASLAVRHRETYHFSHANPREVYLADVGEGISIAIFGLQQRHRFPLECTMGYLIISNGAPIGYGGASVLFRQLNTGVNIFDEYRGSEAAFLWVQVMRAYHHVTGCTRYIANPYQFGADNNEALRSGAFWFYYRLGYRPVLQDIRKLASREFEKATRNKGYRSDLKTLRRLASCDMHLTLPGALQSDLFDERWIETSSMLATEVLSAAGGRTRRATANRVAAGLARDIGIRSFDSWTTAERRGFRQIAPIVAVASPKNWSTDAKRSMRKLLRAKGGDCEAKYARLLCRHAPFLAALRKACRKDDHRIGAIGRE